MSFAKGLVDFDQKSLAYAAAAIAFNPIYWNIIARAEYHHQIISRFTGKLYGCYTLGLSIFLLGLFRDYLYESALRSQPSADWLTSPAALTASASLFTFGNILVLSSMWALGVTGTYLGDYFGILMDEKVTGFPFNVTSAPMYYGSTMSFVGTAIWYGKPAGLLLSAEVLAIYLVALRFEDPFTSEIYAKRERDRAVRSKKAI